MFGLPAEHDGRDVLDVPGDRFLEGTGAKSAAHRGAQGLLCGVPVPLPLPDALCNPPKTLQDAL